MIKIIRVAPSLIIFLVMILMAVPVYADTPDPDSTPTIDRMNIYHNLLETGDALIVWAANIPYATIPPSRVGDAFYWELFATDGTTEKAYINGYAYHDNGYGYNVYSMYFRAADSYTWSTNYPLKLIGTTNAFTSPHTYTFSAGNYTTLTTQAENKAALAEEILYLAKYLDNKWGLTGEESLILETEVSSFLSLTGEGVFRNIIYGCQAMAPAAFRFALNNNLTFDDRTWTTTYNGSLESQYAGSWVDTARNASIDFFGLSYDLLGLILLLGACTLILILNLSLSADHWGALIDVVFMLVIASRLGVFGLAYMILIFVVAIIYMGMRLWRMIPT